MIAARAVPAEICADCGRKIGMLGGSYYRKDPASDFGKTYHMHCGDPFGVNAAVAAERERCAKIAESFEDYTGAGHEDENSLIGMFARGNRSARKQIADAIRR